MANQMIALQVRPPQTPGLGAAISQNAQLMNMMSQQRAAQRQAEQAQQTMDINAAQEARAVRMAEPQFAKAQSEAAGADIKTAMDFNEFVRTALSNSDSPDQVAALATRIAGLPQFQNPLFQGTLSDAVASMPTDPAQFEAWKEKTFLGTLEADKRYAQEFQKQTTGTEERVIAMPKYGRGAATEVPGSRIQVAEGMQYVKDDQGNVFAMPKEKPGSFGTPSPTAGAPAKGSVAAALQTNPGALKDGAFARSQPGYAGASGGFATFKTPEDGARAQENLLRTAYVNKGFNTIDKIINRYAPQGPENSAASVSNYKKYVARQTGIDMSAPISANQIPAVAKAMREFETGQTQGRGTAAGPTPVIKGSAPAKARSAAQAAKSKYDSTIAVARRLLNNPALDSIVGNIQGNIPETALSVLSQDAANALSDYNNLMTIAGFQELQTMRDNSPTGGALGQVSDSENKMLQQSAFASSRTQSEAKFRQSVKDYIARLEGSRDRVLRAYEDQFGERISGGGGKAPAKSAAGAKTPTSRLSAETRAKYGL
jgi:hypothetical protein